MKRNQKNNRRGSVTPSFLVLVKSRRQKIGYQRAQKQQKFISPNPGGWEFQDQVTTAKVTSGSWVHLPLNIATPTSVTRTELQYSPQTCSSELSHLHGGQLHPFSCSGQNLGVIFSFPPPHIQFIRKSYQVSSNTHTELITYLHLTSYSGPTIPSLLGCCRSFMLAPQSILNALARGIC